MSKTKYEPDVMVKAVQEHLNGQASQQTIADRLGITKTTFQMWIRKYRSMGPDAFIQEGQKHYPKELKEQAVADYLAGRGSLQSICEIYKIMSTKQLLSWITKYNGHEELKASGTGGTIIMTKGRKTTFDERVEIVQYCIAHDHNYAEAAAKYSISYQQARNYTVKYETDGIEALRDRRGRKKPLTEMSELERLRAENKILRAEKEHAEMEASFLKKLDEIERRRG